MLILAAITINLLIADDGLFNKAQQSQLEQRKAEVLDQLYGAEAAVSVEYLGKPTIENFLEQIYTEQIVVEEDTEDLGNGAYNVCTEDGLVFTVSAIIGTNTNDIVYEYVGQSGNLPASIRVTNTTTNSVAIEVLRAEGVTEFKYSYKLHTDDSYTVVQESSNSNTYTYTGLISNTIYDLQVEFTKDGEPITITKSVLVGEIPSGAIKLREVTWSNGVATAVIYTEEDGYQIEWQIGAIEEAGWTRESAGVKEVSISNVQHGQIIYARLYDGTSSGKEASIEIEDKESPNVEIIFNRTILETTDELTAQVSQTDTESGVNISQTKWVFNTETGNIGTDTSSYTGTFTQTPETITLPTDTAGTYYLHVLTIDYAGNAKEVIGNAITITQKDPTKDWDLSKVDKVESADGIIVPVPKGYTASEVSTEDIVENTVKDGFVIYENTNGEDRYEPVTNESDIEEAQTTRNQFVWVPVENVHDLYGTDSTGKKWGKLYVFSAGGITPLNWTEQDEVMSITEVLTSREPDGTRYDENNTNLQQAGLDSSATIDTFKTQLETEFNNMIESVTTYGGFYIGRYETGNLSQLEAMVVKNNSDIRNQTWYTMYNKSKGIAANSNVTTTMIWGCQWDATLRWMYNSGDEEKKTYTYEYKTGKGNYAGTQTGGNKVIPTGSNPMYAVNNIYDMTGNVRDWTIETYDTSVRISRGAFWANGQGFPTSYRQSTSLSAPTESSSSIGSRVALYIN